MPDKKLAFALAMEAMTEEDELNDTYQILETTREAEAEIAEANRAMDTAIGLENLHAVLESFTQLTPTELGLLQVIGDISGAVHGVDGGLFTPALEDVEDIEFKDKPNEEAPSVAEKAGADSKAKAIMEQVMAVLNKVAEKVMAFIKWIGEKIFAAIRQLKAGARALRKKVGMSTTSDKIYEIKYRLAQVEQLATMLMSFTNVASDMATATLSAIGDPAFANRNAKFSQGVISKFTRVEVGMRKLADTYGVDTHPSGGSVHTAFCHMLIRIGEKDNFDYSTSEALLRSLSKSLMKFEITKPEDFKPKDFKEGETKITDSLVREIEDSLDLVEKLTNPNDRASLPGLAKMYNEDLNKAIRDRMLTVSMHMTSNATAATSAISLIMSSLVASATVIQQAGNGVRHAIAPLMTMDTSVKQVGDNPNAETLQPA